MMQVAHRGRHHLPCILNPRPLTLVQGSTVCRAIQQAQSMDHAYTTARSQFAYFHDPQQPVFLENAGGSQAPECVIDAVASYMRHDYAQLGAGHPVSNRATATVAEARKWMRVLMNAPEGSGEIMLGSSTSVMMRTLSSLYQQLLKPGDEVVVQELSHESNISPWLHMAKHSGATVKWWKMPVKTPQEPFTGGELSGLAEVLSPATRLVAITHVSNLLGEVQDLAAAVALIRQHVPAARVIVDGVAYAPHRRLDMQAWGVDAYAFSAYKVYGPHMAVLYVSQPAISELLKGGAEGPNHYFVDRTDFAYKFELGGVNHEGCAGLLGLQHYLARMAHSAGAEAMQYPPQQQEGGKSQTRDHYRCWLPRHHVESAFDLMTRMEQPLQEQLLGYLQSKKGVVLLGSSNTHSNKRVPTVSFVHETIPSHKITQDLQDRGFAVRHGHMYASRLVEHFLRSGANPVAAANKQYVPSVVEGVVRVSALHYNTPQEMGRLVLALEEVLS